MRGLSQYVFLLPMSAGRSVDLAKTSSEAVFMVKGRRVRAWLTSFGISIIPASSSWWKPWANLRYIPDALLFEEVLSATAQQHSQRTPCRCQSSRVKVLLCSFPFSNFHAAAKAVVQLMAPQLVCICGALHVERYEAADSVW